MRLYSLYSKLRDRWTMLHTKMVGASLGAYGGGGWIESPVRIPDPKRVFVGKDLILCSQVMLNCVTSWAGEEYHGEIHIGNHSQIRENVQVSAATKLVIGSLVGISRNCLIIDHAHSHTTVDVPLDKEPLTRPRPVVIEDECIIGANSMICPGVRIGYRSIVGFGSMVTKSVPPYSVVIGSPARIISRYDPETEKWVISRRKL